MDICYNQCACRIPIFCSKLPWSRMINGKKMECTEHCYTIPIVLLSQAKSNWTYLFKLLSKESCYKGVFTVHDPHHKLSLLCPFRVFSSLRNAIYLLSIPFYFEHGQEAGSEYINDKISSIIDPWDYFSFPDPPSKLWQ